MRLFDLSKLLVFIVSFSMMAMVSQRATGSAKVAVDPSLYHFVLVHGFGSGAWGWFKVRALLEGSGFKVTCLDLKASGIDPSPVSSINSFEDYNQPLTDFFSNYSPADISEKVILVGHSAGGLSVTHASHKFSNKIHVAVYLAATMLKHGYAAQQDLIDGTPAQLRSGSRPKVDQFISQEDKMLADMLRRPGPLDAIKEAKFTGSKADNVPRVYIKTLKDQVLTKEQQESMIKRWPPTRVLEIDSDHNPNSYFPLLLSGLLVDAATKMFIDL